MGIDEVEVRGPLECLLALDLVRPLQSEMEYRLSAIGEIEVERENRVYCRGWAKREVTRRVEGGVHERRCVWRKELYGCPHIRA